MVLPTCFEEGEPPLYLGEALCFMVPYILRRLKPGVTEPTPFYRVWLSHLQGALVLLPVHGKRPRVELPRFLLFS